MPVCSIQKFGYNPQTTSNECVSSRLGRIRHGGESDRCVFPDKWDGEPTILTTSFYSPDRQHSIILQRASVLLLGHSASEMEKKTAVSFLEALEDRMESVLSDDVEWRANDCGTFEHFEVCRVCAETAEKQQFDSLKKVLRYTHFPIQRKYQLGLGADIDAWQLDTLYELLCDSYERQETATSLFATESSDSASLALNLRSSNDSKAPLMISVGTQTDGHSVMTSKRETSENITRAILRAIPPHPGPEISSSPRARNPACPSSTMKSVASSGSSRITKRNSSATTGLPRLRPIANTMSPIIKQCSRATKRRGPATIRS